MESALPYVALLLHARQYLACQAFNSFMGTRRKHPLGQQFPLCQLLPCPPGEIGTIYLMLSPGASFSYSGAEDRFRPGGATGAVSARSDSPEASSSRQAFRAPWLSVKAAPG